MKNPSEENNRDSGILSNPLSFVRNGMYDWGGGIDYARSTRGYYALPHSQSINYSSMFYFHNTNLDPKSGGSRGSSFAVRYLGLAPDSICPKGWQLPTYSGDKSFTTLINTSYSMKNTAEAPEADNKDSGILSNPLSFVRSGGFDWSGAGLSNRGGGGNYWSLRSSSTTGSSYLYFYGASLNPQSPSARGVGFAMRCANPLLHPQKEFRKY